MTETNEPETPETFASAVSKLRTFGAFPDQARIDAVVAAHEREVEELNYIIAISAVESVTKDATIAELKERKANN